VRGEVEFLMDICEKAKNIKNEDQQNIILNLISIYFDSILDPKISILERFRKAYIEVKGGPPDTFWSNIYELLENKDMEAARRLMKRWFYKKAIFYRDRLRILEPHIYERLGEENNLQEIWEQLIASAMHLAWDDMNMRNLYKANNPIVSIDSIKDVKHSAAYSSLLQGLRKEIEQDLLGGITADTTQDKLDASHYESVSEYEEKEEDTTDANVSELISKLEGGIDMREFLQGLLPQLSEEEKQFFWEKSIGFTDKEIASHLGIELAALRKRMERSRKKLKERFAD
jgi:DNA-directed RNA polymerase specialized sigma24 family protein